MAIINHGRDASKHEIEKLKEANLANSSES